MISTLRLVFGSFGSLAISSVTPSPILLLSNFDDVHLVGQFDAIDGEDDVAGLDVEAALVGRAALQHLRDLQPRSAIRFVEDQPEVGRPLVRASASGR